MGKYIVIEGVMGVGKTTLINRLKEELNIPCVMQDFEHNVCLTDYYAGGNCAFEKQMIFLFSNYYILSKAGESFSVFMSDYCFERSLAISKSILDSQEFYLFKENFEFLKRRFNKEKMIIFLYGTKEKILSNIKKRGRKNEQNITLDFIDKQQGVLIDNLERFGADYIVKVNINEVDILSTESINFLKNEINKFLTKKEVVS